MDHISPSPSESHFLIEHQKNGKKRLIKSYSMANGFDFKAFFNANNLRRMYMTGYRGRVCLRTEDLVKVFNMEKRISE